MVWPAFGQKTADCELSLEPVANLAMAGRSKMVAGWIQYAPVEHKLLTPRLGRRCGWCDLI